MTYQQEAAEAAAKVAAIMRQREELTPAYNATIITDNQLMSLPAEELIERQVRHQAIVVLRSRLNELADKEAAGIPNRMVNALANARKL